MILTQCEIIVNRSSSAERCRGWVTDVGEEFMSVWRDDAVSTTRLC